ncbi:hypothetical protein HHI36_004981 [Cryptolaemus montrouzieri]|uniref:Uncharacterized protein n=1 Tax=Cryptolaemus montrouzieri TaxID=559131 RepID=A0ABD2NUD7_9CUCU
MERIHCLMTSSFSDKLLPKKGFPGELVCLKNHKYRIRLLHSNPFLDDDGLIRVGGSLNELYMSSCNSFLITSYHKANNITRTSRYSLEYWQLFILLDKDSGFLTAERVQEK